MCQDLVFQETKGTILRMSFDPIGSPNISEQTNESYKIRLEEPAESCLWREVTYAYTIFFFHDESEVWPHSEAALSIN